MSSEAPQGHPGLEAVVCRGCGGAQAQLLFEAQGYPILECHSCGLAYTGQSFDQAAAREYYGRQYYSQAGDYADAMKRAAPADNEGDRERVRLAARLASCATGRVLDVGCAAGGLLAAFRRAGWQCWGVEPSAELAAGARELLGCQVYEGLLEEAPLGPESFDAVTAVHVLEHVPAPRRFLECCRRLLRPGGALLLEVPDFGCRAARRRRAAWRPLYPDTHLCHFTGATLSRFLGESGFRVALLRRYGGLGPLAPSQRADEIKRRVFEARRLAYRLPGFKHFARYVYWQLLGMNDYLSAGAVRQ